jgi:mutual gliding-motility protein MglA
MVLFNYTTKELTAKIVYYGPGLCGKTTNLQFVYESLPAHVKKGKMLSLATKTDRTLFFDFLPIELGRIRGMRTRIQLYTVPGQVFYNSTRKLVLKGADGVVFVADSQQKMLESDVESYRNLEENLREIGLKMEEMPLVMQFNKRDLPQLASVEEMNTLINRHNAPFYEAVATSGIGVEDTLKAVTKLVLNHLASKYHLGAPVEEPSREAVSVAADATHPLGELEGDDAAQDSSAEFGVDTGEPAIPLASPEEEGMAALAEGMEPDAAGRGAERRRMGREPEAEESPSGENDDLELLAIGEDNVGIDSAPGAIDGPGLDWQPGSEDLSELLEEIPDDVATTNYLDSPSVPPSRTAFASGDRSVAGVAAVEPVARPQAAERVAPSAPIAKPTTSRSDGVYAVPPLDPLGIDDAGTSAPVTRAIQIGTVTPGHQHQITVPLEMSVQGRKVRFQLRMTLTLTS